MPALLGVGVKEKMAPFHMTGLSLSLFLKIYLCYFFLAVERLHCFSRLL